MPLNLAEFEKNYRIGKICGPEKQKHYLESLGFTVGGQIQVLSELHGYYIVMVKQSRIGIEKKMARGIILIAE